MTNSKLVFNNETFKSQALADFAKAVVEREELTTDIIEGLVAIEGRTAVNRLVNLVKSNSAQANFLRNDFIEKATVIGSVEPIVQVINDEKGYNSAVKARFKQEQVSLVHFGSTLKEDKETGEKFKVTNKEYSTWTPGREHKGEDKELLVPMVDNPNVPAGRPAFTDGVISIYLASVVDWELIKLYGAYYNRATETLYIPKNEAILYNFTDITDVVKIEDIKRRKSERLEFIFVSDSSTKGVTARATTDSYRCRYLYDHALVRKCFKDSYLKDGKKYVSLNGIKKDREVSDVLKRLGANSTSTWTLLDEFSVAYLVDKDGNLADFKELSGGISNDGLAYANAEKLVEPVNDSFNEAGAKRGLCKVRITLKALLEVGDQDRPDGCKDLTKKCLKGEILDTIAKAYRQGLTWMCVGADTPEECQYLMTASTVKLGIPEERGSMEVVSNTKSTSSSVNCSTQIVSKAIEKEHVEEIANILVEATREQIIKNITDCNFNRPYEYYLNRSAKVLANRSATTVEEWFQIVMDNGAMAKNIPLNQKYNKMAIDVGLRALNAFNTKFKGMTRTLLPEIETSDGKSLHLTSELRFCRAYAEIVSPFYKRDKLKADLDRVIEEQKKTGTRKELTVLIERLNKRIKQANAKCDNLDELHLIARCGKHYRLTDLNIKYPSQDTDEFDVTEYLSEFELKERCKKFDMPDWVFDSMMSGSRSYVYMPATEYHRLMLAGYDFDKDQDNSNIDKRIVTVFAKVKASRQMMMLNVSALTDKSVVK